MSSLSGHGRAVQQQSVGWASATRPYIVALGDLGAFVLFGAIGLASHEEGVSVEVVARSVAPFPVAWFVVAPWFGAFRRRADQGWGPGLRLAVVWLIAGVLALAGRAVVFERELFNAFFVIALVGNGLFLGAWRAIYNWWTSRRGERRSPSTRPDATTIRQTGTGARS